MTHKGGNLIKQQSPSTRFWEIDAGRGVAIVLMVIYHASYDLNYFDLIDIDPIAGWWLLFASVIATSFLFVAGISLAISHMRRKQRSNALSHQVRRGARIFGWGLLLSLFTVLVIPDMPIFFGILHLIGVSIIISGPFLERTRTSLLVGACVIAVGVAVWHQHYELPIYLWPLLKTWGVATADYFPLLPWWGVVLLGIGVGRIAYPGGERIVDVPSWGDVAPIRALSVMGRRSLFIYLLHQPMLFSILLAVTGTMPL